MGWYVKVETTQYEADEKYSSYTEPQRAIEDVLQNKMSWLVGKEIKEITARKS
ncbi:hypothetical protein LRY65_03975 [Candidatus Woesebacteria bacterium]|nr:hypothetical protein [Candidatus Woesebacteria bacterium]MCD8507091.1 hypothetical protein [Candidatus Woesebacteria bacterium]MCD8527340.1 hypothetical protein [Candidatus Woesebacteria bacterium]MCD8546086.1 hypothetical protein [Candidatus Woesebacteria bacterium]